MSNDYRPPPSTAPAGAAGGSQPGAFLPPTDLPRLDLLGEDGVHRVHQATLDVLGSVGLDIPWERGLGVLAEHGASVEGTRVRMSAELVEKGLSFLSRDCVFAARDERFDLALDGCTTYLGPSGCGMLMVDRFTGEWRDSTYDDLAALTRICDALPEIAFAWQMVSALDRPVERQPLWELEATFANTGKHVQCMTVTKPHQARAAVEMARLVAGGADELRRRPVMSNFQCSISPLANEGEALEAAFVFAEAGVPVGIVSMPLACGTAPASPAGNLVIVNAEIIGTLATLGLVCPGARAFYSCMTSVLDPLTGRMAGGAPEEAMVTNAATAMARFYKLPSLMGGMACGSTRVGWQSAFEDALTGTMILLARPDAMVGPGLLENATVCDPAELLLGVELWNALTFTARPIQVDDDTLALETIAQVGPRGHFLATKHSMRHARLMWRPQLLSRARMDPGTDDPVARARARAWEVADTHAPIPLEPAVAEALKEIAGAGVPA
ncbi:MAG: trimethylamine methyltransferase family protein [Actinobacteria bacterium]|nr:trimethylamine methyltransferase family protein [Actinomycetota bacterium]